MVGGKPNLTSNPIGKKNPDFFQPCTRYVINIVRCCLALEFAINRTNPAIDLPTLSDPYLFEEWLKHGRGPLTVPVSDGLAYTISPSGKGIELIFVPLGSRPDTFAMGVMLQQPDARGTVTLKSKSPWHPPAMSYNYFDEKTDLDDNVYGVEYAVRLVEETAAFRDVAATLRPHPKCDGVPFKSDRYWVCVSKHSTHTYQHQCGTCRMGDVVDHKLQVIGVGGLRVVDSSIFPYMPSAHLYGPTLMVGEKGADMIRSHWSS